MSLLATIIPLSLTRMANGSDTQSGHTEIKTSQLNRREKEKE
jgi:hypothetical protein